MKYFILFISIMACILNSCSENYQKNKKSTTPKTNVVFPDSTELFHNFYKQIECETNTSEIEILTLEHKIDSLLDKLVFQIKTSNKDTILINPLLDLLKGQKNNYKIEIKHHADLIFWSYGVSSMQGERIVARDCYYLSELRKRYSMLQAIYTKIHGTLLDL